jgi:hypothetical protein
LSGFSIHLAIVQLPNLTSFSRSSFTALVIFAVNKLQLKILFDHQAFSMQNNGGISRYYANLYEAFNSREDTSCEISLLYSENYFVKNINQPQHFKWAKPLFGKSKSRIARWNKRYNSIALPLSKTDIFHPTYYDPYYINKVEQPVVITVHDMIYERMPGYFPDSDKIISYKKKLLRKPML